MSASSDGGSWPGGYDRYTAEGNALRVGLPSLLVTLSRFDPDLAVASSPCLGEWDDSYPFAGGFRLD